VIPVIGVPILNRPELLDALIDSIDVRVEQTIVVDNGKLFDLYGSESKLSVIQPGHNIGVSASWNLVMQVTPHAPWWLLVNNDVTFGPGDLAILAQTIDPERAAIYQMPSFSAFAMTQPGLTAVGYFDESATIYSDARYRFRNGFTHPANDEYYARKWGGPKEGGETFTTPFNQGGHVGDWRLDPERLRNQAW
jgi:hypothetical protein